MAWKMCEDMAKRYEPHKYMEKVSMIRKFNILLVAVAMTGFLGACSDNDAEYAEMDRSWDAADSAFMADYETVRAANARLEEDLQAMRVSSDSMATARYAEMQQKIAANRQTLQEMETRRSEAQAARDAARAAADRAAYENARSTSDYDAWRADLDRIRAEQKEMEGMIMVGDRSIGGIDANVRDTSQPLLRVEPGKEDDKPLIELNKNP